MCLMAFKKYFASNITSNIYGKTKQVVRNIYCSFKGFREIFKGYKLSRLCTKYNTEWYINI